MADRFDTRFGAPSPATGYGREAAGYDAGLRKHMLTVYNYMASAVLLTGIVALLFWSTGAVNSLVNWRTGGLSVLGWVLALAPLGVVLWLSFGINRISQATAQFLFWTYAVLIGISLSTVLIVYTSSSVATAFFAAAAAFASLSLWGYTTKRDLSGLGVFLMMGLVGLLVAMLLNVFLQSGPLGMAISFIGVLIFAGLTAFDTQKTKEVYYVVGGNGAALGKAQIIGALNLYLDFINMFLFILRLIGDRR